jgi:hypothetical protein
MLQPTLVTWILVVFGVVFVFLLLLYAQLLMVLRPRGQATKNILIGKGEVGVTRPTFECPMVLLGLIS